MHGRHGDNSLTVCCNMRHPVKKRRCKKRKSLMVIGQTAVVGANVSEGLDGGSTTSDSCCNDATLTRHTAKYMDCVARLSDSDAATVTVAVLPAVAMVTNALVESDSVTENWSPLRPQRRRRHNRRMIVDDLCSHDNTQPAKHCQMVALPYSSSQQQQQSHCSQVGHELLLPGKRKRTVKEKSDVSNSFDYDGNEDISHLKPLMDNGQCTKMQLISAHI
jgi:G patch domain-containing protein 2